MIELNSSRRGIALEVINNIRGRVSEDSEFQEEGSYFRNGVQSARDSMNRFLDELEEEYNKF